MITTWIRNNVVGLIAIFIALGGTTYAANQVSSSDIEKNAVKSKHIGSGQVKTVDLAVDAVTGAQVNESSIGKVPSAAAADSAPPVGTAGGDLTGAYPNPSIGAGAVTGAEVANESLTSADVEDFTLSVEDLENTADLFGCQDGAVHGRAVILGDATFPSTFTAGLTASEYNCNFPGETGHVTARRFGFGAYCVRFEDDNGLGVPMVTSSFVASAAVARRGAGGSCPVDSYEIYLEDVAGNPIDETFQVVTF